MAGQEIGTYYVSLMPSGRGFEKAAQGQAETAFKGAEKTSDGFFSGVAKWAKRGAFLIGGMVATVGGLAATGGISRALNIEDATAKLKGLGHDTASVDAIMKDALASVKGTAFGLDKAATTAASAVAAGIKPGQELEKYLRLTADAATIAGTSMEEMGGIINAVTSKGYAGMENLNRLTERGIPIMQWLQEEYGVTADELAKMVSRGEIDAETFRRAIEKNIGGAALESGETTRGAFANMRAALSRLGLAFVGDGLSGAKTFFKEVTVILDGLTDRVGPWVATINDKLKGAFEIEGMGTRFLDGLDWFIKDFDSTPLGILLDALKPLIPVIRDIGEKVGPVLADTFREIWKALEPMVPLIADTLVDAIIDLAPPFTDLLIALIPLIPPLVRLATKLMPALVWLVEVLVPKLIDFARFLEDVAVAYQGMADIFEGRKPIVKFGEDIINSNTLVGEWSRKIIDVFDAAIAKVEQFGSFWATVWAAVSGVFGAVIAAIKNMAAGLWRALPQGLRDAINSVSNMLNILRVVVQVGLASAGSWLVSSGQAVIDGFISGIRSRIRAVADAVGAVMATARGFFPNSPAKWGPFSGEGWRQLTRSGGAIMDEFLGGLTAGTPVIQAALNQSVSVPVLSGAAGGFSMPSELVVRDVDGALISRMQVEAAGVVSAHGSSVASGIRSRRRSDA